MTQSREIPMYRSLAVPTLTKREDEEKKVYQFRISTPDRDRHGTVILPDAWRLDNYKANPIVAYQHHTGDDWWTGRISDPDDIIGTSKVWREGNDLIAEVDFEPLDLNEKADKIRRKVDHGTLRAVSVGFKPIRGHWGDQENDEDTGTYYFDEVELLEFSIVNIPSNPAALKRAMEQQNSALLPAKETKPEPKVEKSRMAMNHNIFKHLKSKKYVKAT